MTSRDERIAILAEANRVRRKNKRQAVEDALQALVRSKSKVNVSAIAASAGVSRNFVYAQSDLLKQIRDTASGQPDRLHRPRTVSSTEASLRARLTTALDALNKAKEDIATLEARVERVTAELATQISSNTNSAN